MHRRKEWQNKNHRVLVNIVTRLLFLDKLKHSIICPIVKLSIKVARNKAVKYEVENHRAVQPVKPKAVILEGGDG